MESQSDRNTRDQLDELRERTRRRDLSSVEREQIDQVVSGGVAARRPWRWARSPITGRVHATASRRVAEEEALCGVATLAGPEVVDLAGSDVCLICLQKLSLDRTVVQP